MSLSNMGWKSLSLLICIVCFPKIKGCSNLALLKPAAVSFLSDPNTGPEHAVDGVNATFNYIPNSVYCSFVETHAITGWWQVDLQVTVSVGSVRITTAEYAYGRPKDFLLEVYPDSRCDSGPQVCHQYNGVLQGAETVTVSCTTPARGRIVRLTQVDPFYLCELQVFPAEDYYDSFQNYRGLKLIKYPEMKRALTSSVQMEAESIVACSLACISHNMCPYFNYKKQETFVLCEIPSCVNSSDVLTNMADWDYYEQDPCYP